MPINHDLKCIFIHIPRTGGSTIEKLLDMENLDEKGFSNIHDEKRLFGRIQDGTEDNYLSTHLQHLTAHEIKQRVGEEIWNNYFKFTIVRNPWDRIISIYKYGDGSLKNKLKTVTEKKYKKIGFNEFLDKIQEIELRNIHLLPQYNFINYNNKLMLDYIGYFENYNQVIQEIFKILDLNLKEIPKSRKSNRLNFYPFYYTPNRFKKIKRMYKEDIVKLNYSFLSFGK